MKRGCCILMALILVLGASSALGKTLSEVMCVANCSEWVSLRETPDTSSARLTKVYLGELVTDCAPAWNGFVFCRFDGREGYILEKYLEQTAFTAGDGLLRNQMAVDVMEYVSLLDAPSSSGRLLKRVPVGAVVTSCVTAGGNYVLCRYQGTRGYVRAEYLHDADYGISQRSASVAEKYAGAYPDLNGPVEVVNCTEWVSLRLKPSTSALRLARVPLGTVVEGCLQVSDAFVYCCYRGIWGYIGREYLLDRGTASPEAGSSPEVLEDRLLKDGTGRRVLAQRTYRTEGEVLYAALYDAEGTLVSAMSAVNGTPGQYAVLDAFVGGTDAAPVLLWFTGSALSAHALSPGMEEEVLWSLPLRDAGIFHAVDRDGTVYLIGYETDRLTCISPAGQLLWQIPHSDPENYWPCGIVLREDGVEVRYSGGRGQTVTYSRAAASGGAGTAGRVTAELAAGQDADYRFSAAAGAGTVGVLITAAERVTNFQVLALTRSPDGTGRYTARVLCTLPVLQAGATLLVTAALDGAGEETGFAYTDASGGRSRWAMGLSGEDGSLQVWQIDPE